MRLFFATLLVLLAAIYLHLEGVQRDTKYDKNKFYYNNLIAYIKLLEELRARLASGTDVHRISVTRPPENIPLQERFVQVQLKNGGEELIIVIIDTVNVYLVGYLSGSTLRPTLYYLDDIPREELLQAFPSTDYTHSRLGFSGNYGSLPDRDRIELRHSALNYAIINLYYGRSQPSVLLGHKPQEQMVGSIPADPMVRPTVPTHIDGHESLDSIILLKCQGWGNQRWADGTILNPNAPLVMDVQSSDMSLQDIILYQLTRNPNQKWLAYGFHS
nr:ribosome-inactivating protein [Tanacetum cinerariifolium]